MSNDLDERTGSGTVPLYSPSTTYPKRKNLSVSEPTTSKKPNTGKGKGNEDGSYIRVTDHNAIGERS